MKYKWNPRKLSSRVHICNDAGMSLCKVEHGTKRELQVLDNPPMHGKMCMICEDLFARGKRDPGGNSDWSIERLESAEIVCGPETGKTDTYRLIVNSGDSEMRLDVPGWMVGDDDMAALKLRAARIIRRRLTDV